MAMDLPPGHVRHAVMLQRWCDLTFIHWRYPVELVQRRVPPPLEVESFNGSAWVGITPFVVRDLRPVFLPSLPWLSHFPETNCRTYVRGPDGHPGVWFFSLEAGRAAAVAGARAGYGLPYAWARMSVDRTRSGILYKSARIVPDRSACTDIVVEPGDPIAPTPFDVFLTARFRLYSFILGCLTYTNVEHPPWPLQSARLLRAHQTLTTSAGLPQPEEPVSALFSRGVPVRVDRPRRVG